MGRKLEFDGVDRLSEHTLSDVLAVSYAAVKPYIYWLNEWCPRFGINTAERLAAFLAQVAHESGRFMYVSELASGQAYEGRKDLGNIQKGDGVRFKGRGLIQITGRANYTELAEDTGIDCLVQPELLLLPEYAVLSACWFWRSRGLSKLADRGEFREITRRINGGYNGLEDREKLHKKFRRMLNI